MKTNQKKKKKKRLYKLMRKVNCLTYFRLHFNFSKYFNELCCDFIIWFHFSVFFFFSLVDSFPFCTYEARKKLEINATRNEFENLHIKSKQTLTTEHSRYEHSVLGALFFFFCLCYSNADFQPLHLNLVSCVHKDF